jgi:hypothetical protein
MVGPFAGSLEASARSVRQSNKTKKKAEEIAEEQLLGLLLLHREKTAKIERNEARQARGRVVILGILREK